MKPPTSPRRPFRCAGVGALGASSSSPFAVDPDIIELPMSSSSSVAASSYVWGSGNQKRKRSKFIMPEVIDVDGDDDSDGVTIIGETLAYQKKDKQPAVSSRTKQKYVADVLASVVPGPSTNPLAKDFFAVSPIPLNGGLPEYQYELECFYPDEDCFVACDADSIDMDKNYSLGEKFDDLDIPPGVEAAVPRFQIPVQIPIFLEDVEKEDEKKKRYKDFKQFDIVVDHSDHHFAFPMAHCPLSNKPSKSWRTAIQHEWKVLEKDLPETIFVRVYEDRMDLLRAVIVGPAGTPYHDGLFFFDVFFPPNYPSVPPLVNYRSGGLRLNPNLYACGKVCLSLLNTWSGTGCERWNPSKSTMLQILVSVQALVLNSKPYFNEPGFAMHANTVAGEQKSHAYNEDTFLLSCKTMLYSLRNPPKHFEKFVLGHFRKYGQAILVSCRAYIDGAQVGCLVGKGIQDVDEGDKSCSAQFKALLRRLFEDLLKEFAARGADCAMFLPPSAQRSSLEASADTALRL